MRHWWSGGAFDGYPATRVRYYVDGDPEFTVDMPLGPSQRIGCTRDTIHSRLATARPPLSHDAGTAPRAGSTSGGETANPGMAAGGHSQ